MTRKRVYEILEVAAAHDRASRIFDIFILSLITANVCALILETVPALHARARGAFLAFETISVLIFTVEYVLRIWSSIESPRFSASKHKRLRFAATPMALIDLFAILPFYLPMLGLDLRFMRALRLFRIIRIAKLARYSTAMKSFADVLRSKQAELLTLASFLSMLLIFASSLIYYAEHTAQPENFSSIPAAMWWSIVTLTTVGYGDVYPVTVLGKMLTAVIAVLGIGLFALPTGILGAAFVEQMEEKKERKRKKAAKLTCPKCGANVER